MAVERAAGGTSLIDVLDRVLDKGIVIDAWVRVSLVGIDLITVEARIVVASIDTYLKYSEAVGQMSPISRPAAELPSHQDVVAENVALRAELAASKSSRADLVAAAKKSKRASAPPLSVRGITPGGPCRRAGGADSWSRLGSEARLRRVSADEHRRPGIRPPRRRLARRPRHRQRGGRARLRRHLERDAARRRTRHLQRRDHGLRAEPRRRAVIPSSRP